MKSWKTTLLGVLTIACATLGGNVLPAQYHDLAIHACAFLSGLGLIVAKDSNVSHTKP